MGNRILGSAAEGKLSQIPLSNDPIRDRIEDMSKDILAQVVAGLISSPAKLRLPLDETTDVSNLSQLAVFVRYVKDDMIKEDSRGSRAWRPAKLYLFRLNFPWDLPVYMWRDSSGGSYSCNVSRANLCGNFVDVNLREPCVNMFRATNTIYTCFQPCVALV